MAAKQNAIIKLTKKNGNLMFGKRILDLGADTQELLVSTLVKDLGVLPTRFAIGFLPFGKENPFARRPKICMINSELSINRQQLIPMPFGFFSVTTANIGAGATLGKNWHLNPESLMPIWFPK